MFKLLLFMKRRPGLSVAAFRDYYENHHVPLALQSAVGIKRYIRRYLDPQPNAETGCNDELAWDVITELWFDDEAVFKGTVRYLSTTVLSDDIIADELNLFDRSKNRIATVVEHETDMGALSR